MKKALRLDIVSDVSCPWCVIGYYALAQALENMAGKIEADIEWQPFELNPQMPVAGQAIDEHLREKYGSTPAQSAQTHQTITERGAALGFQFDFQRQGRIYNTFDAHRLLQWVARERQTALQLALFELYFTRGGNPSDHDELLATVGSIGLDPAEAGTILESKQYHNRVRSRQSHYRSLGVNSVPTVIINDRYSLVGGHPVATFEQALNDLLASGDH